MSLLNLKSDQSSLTFSGAPISPESQSKLSSSFPCLLPSLSHLTSNLPSPPCSSHQAPGCPSNTPGTLPPLGFVCTCPNSAQTAQASLPLPLQCSAQLILLIGSWRAEEEGHASIEVHLDHRNGREPMRSTGWLWLRGRRRNNSEAATVRDIWKDIESWVRRSFRFLSCS